MFEPVLNMSVQLALAMMLFVLAAFRGDVPERLLAGTLAVVLSFDLLVICHVLVLLPDGWDCVIVDVLAFGIIAGVAIRANRMYPLLFGAAQLVKLSSHVWWLGLSNPVPLAHLMLDEATGYLQLSILAVGIAFHAGRTRRIGGVYPAWTATA